MIRKSGYRFSEKIMLDKSTADFLVAAAFARQLPFGKLGISKPRLGGGAAPRGQRLDPDHPHLAAQSKAQHVADAHRCMGAVRNAAGDADTALLGELLRQRARFHDPREPEEFVEAE